MSCLVLHTLGGRFDVSLSKDEKGLDASEQDLVQRFFTPEEFDDYGEDNFEEDRRSGFEGEGTHCWCKPWG